MISARRAAAIRKEEADAEEATGIHSLSLITLKQRRVGLEELRMSLRCISDEARELVDSVDLLPECSSDLPQEKSTKGEEMVPRSTGDLEAKMIEMARLVQSVAEPASQALEEVHKSRRSRYLTLVFITVALVLNVLTSVHMLRENHHLVERLETLQQAFNGHLVTSGVREAQVNMLINVAKEHAANPKEQVALERLMQIIERPPEKALEAAGRAVRQGAPLDKAVRDALSSPDASLGD